MADQLSGCEVDKVLDAPLRTIVGCLAEVLPKGPAQTALYWVAGLCILATPFIYKYYLGVLAQGAAPEGSLERQDYDMLRASLAGGNRAARLYAKWLTAFLDGVERFLGDAGMADRTIFPRAFGLKTPAPLWTAPAFDRCLFLALIYPIATIFVVWATSGHVGPAEAALGLKPDVPGWARGLAAAAIGFSSFTFWRGARAEGWKSRVWIAGAVAPAVAFAFALSAATAAAATLAIALAVALAVAFAGASDFAGAAVFTAAILVAFTFAIVVPFDFGIGRNGTVPGADAAAGALWVALAVLVLSPLAIKHRLQGLFLSLFLPATVLACFAAAAFLTPLGLVGPLLLFLGLLTLLNAPFDWASLGLTRALLRRGLELAGWWPYLLALLDAALAAAIIAALALVMVLGVQAFDELAVHGGGKPALPLDTLFDGIANNPVAPEYWWAYALLLSSMIPSIINLALGGMAFTRGIPWLARLLLQWIPEGKAVPEYKRQPAAIALTVQMFTGAFLGVAAQGLLVWGLIFRVMPWIGLDLLDMARAVATFDLPARVGYLFAGTP